MSCGVGRQLQLQFRPLTWEPPYAMSAALKRQRQKERKEKKGAEKLNENQVSIRLPSA